MYKHLIATVLFLLTVSPTFSQDAIKKVGESPEEVKITTVTDTYLKYYNALTATGKTKVSTEDQFKVNISELSYYAVASDTVFLIDEASDSLITANPLTPGNLMIESADLLIGAVAFSIIFSAVGMAVTYAVSPVFGLVVTGGGLIGSLILSVQGYNKLKEAGMMLNKTLRK